MSALPRSGIASELPVVARCEKCGREFVSLPKTGREWDPWPPQDKWQNATKAEREKLDTCGGRIVAITSTMGEKP